METSSNSSRQSLQTSLPSTALDVLEILLGNEVLQSAKTLRFFLEQALLTQVEQLREEFAMHRNAAADNLLAMVNLPHQRFTAAANAKQVDVKAEEIEESSSGSEVDLAPLLEQKREQAAEEEAVAGLGRMPMTAAKSKARKTPKREHLNEDKTLGSSMGSSRQRQISRSKSCKRGSTREVQSSMGSSWDRSHRRGQQEKKSSMGSSRHRSRSFKRLSHRQVRRRYDAFLSSEQRQERQ